MLPELLMRNCPRSSAVLAVLAVFASAAMTCNPPIKSTLNRPPTAAEMAQLWQEPRDLARRDLFYGVGGAKLAPEPRTTFTFKAKDTSGYSPGYDVVDGNGLEWSVKQGDEGQTEVVASRLYWALGYHQPPSVLRARVDARRGRREAATIRAVPSRAPGMESRRRLEPARESVCRHAAVSRPSRAARHHQQLGHQTVAEQNLRGHRRAAPAAAAVHHARSGRDVRPPSLARRLAQ